jgi:polyhydroxyalkanoate synthase
MSQFGDCHIRIADLPVGMGLNDLAKLWDGGRLAGRAAQQSIPRKRVDRRMSLVNDHLRRSWAARLKAAGFGPIETPSRFLCRVDGMRLRTFGGQTAGPSLLLVPAPIKRAYIWDLMPGRSVVDHALRCGFNVGLIEWTEPECEDASYGLEDYAHRFIQIAAAAMSERFGARNVLLAGHSLGGTLAAIFAALQPRKVQGLVLVEGPLHFAPGAGALGSLATFAPRAPAAVPSGFRQIPGFFLISALGIAADPAELLTARWIDALASAADPGARAAHLRVVHWALDEFAMPARLFSDVVGQLCRDDQFYQGVLTVTGQRAAPHRLDIPVLAVLEPHSRLVPPQSVLPVLQATSGPWIVCWHQQEAPGVALRHVGALVGSDAYRRLWPRILRWSRAVGKARKPPDADP